MSIAGCRPRQGGILNGKLAIYDRDGRWEAWIITDTNYWASAATNANTAVRFPGLSSSFGAIRASIPDGACAIRRPRSNPNSGRKS